MAQLPFRFTVSPSNEVSLDNFEVVRFTGTEAINRPYEYEIMVMRHDPQDRTGATVTDNICGRTAKLEMLDLDEQDKAIAAVPVHGVVAECEQLFQVGSANDLRTVYRLLLVPRLWMASLRHDTRVFLNQTFGQIIDVVLRENGVTAERVSMRPEPFTTKIEYCCQYQESSLAFLTRWLEREGYFFFFEQGVEHEQLIITNQSSAHFQLPPTGVMDPKQPASTAATDFMIRMDPQASPSGSCENLLTEFARRTRMVSSMVTVRSQDYSKLAPENMATAFTEGPGAECNHYQHDEWFPASGDRPTAQQRAAFRAEAMKWQSDHTTGSGREMRFRPGGKFTLQMTAEEYLLVEVQHKGDQESALPVRLARPDANGNISSPPPGYSNVFKAITARLPYRAEPVTPWPRIHGTISAHTVGSGKVSEAASLGGDSPDAETWALMDSQGRYRVRLPFTGITSRAAGESAWVRQVQPYAGNNFGIHFPLPAGVEVKLAFEYGDPDRPVIVGAVHNPQYPDNVKAGLEHAGGVRTVRGNKLQFNDHRARPGIVMSTGEDMLNRSVMELGYGGLFTSAKLDSHLTNVSGTLVTNVLAGLKSSMVGGYSTSMISGEWLALAAIVGSKLASDEAQKAIWGDQPKNDLLMAMGLQVFDLAVKVALGLLMERGITRQMIPGMMKTLADPMNKVHDDASEAISNIGDVIADLIAKGPGVLMMTNNPGTGGLGAKLKKGILAGSLFRTKQPKPHAVVAAADGNAYTFGNNVMLTATKDSYLLGSDKVVVGAAELKSIAQFEERRIVHAVSDEAAYELKPELFDAVIEGGRMLLKKDGPGTSLQMRARQLFLSTVERDGMERMTGSTKLLPTGANGSSIVLSTAAKGKAGSPKSGATISLTETNGGVEIAAQNHVKIQHSTGATFHILRSGEIHMSTGKSSITLNKMGITIKGPKVTIESTTGPISVKNKAGVAIDGGPGKVTIKGLQNEVG